RGPAPAERRPAVARRDPARPARLRGRGDRRPPALGAPVRRRPVQEPPGQPARAGAAPPVPVRRIPGRLRRGTRRPRGGRRRRGRARGRPRGVRGQAHTAASGGGAHLRDDAGREGDGGTGPDPPRLVRGRARGLLTGSGRVDARRPGAPRRPRGRRPVVRARPYALAVRGARRVPAAVLRELPRARPDPLTTGPPGRAGEAGARAAGHGCSRILIAPSCFFWKISYACGAFSSGQRCVARSITPSGSASSLTSGISSSTHRLTCAWPIRSATPLSNIRSIGSGSAMPPYTPISEIVPPRRTASTAVPSAASRSTPTRDISGAAALPGISPASVCANLAPGEPCA